MGRRHPVVQQQYREYRARLAAEGVGCQFCTEDLSAITVFALPTMLVIRNLFPYNNWEGLSVPDHLMIVPLRHLTRFADFTKAERKDFFKALRRYDKEGYSSYTRAAENTLRTVTHLHTHLIQLEQ